MRLENSLKEQGQQIQIYSHKLNSRSSAYNTFNNQQRISQSQINQEQLLNNKFDDVRKLSSFESKQWKKILYFLFIITIIVFIFQFRILGTLEKQSNINSRKLSMKMVSGQEKSLLMNDNLQQKRKIQQLYKNITKYFSNDLKQQLKVQQYYDLFNFIKNEQTSSSPFVFQKASYETVLSPIKNKNRQIIQNRYSNQEIQQIIGKMMFPQYRRKTFPDLQILKNRTIQNIDMSYFFYQLSNHPTNKQYLLAEYYRYQKFYNIDLYQNQLPLCVVIASRNNVNNIMKMYDSIKRQNYTNYKIIHLDDNSNDETIQATLIYFTDNIQIKQKVTLISQKYQKNSLYNRNLAIMNYCKDGDIILELDAGDRLIGNQVFQLVNSVYQGKNLYKGQRYDLWAAYFSNIQYVKNCCPIVGVSGYVSNQIIKNQTYRQQKHINRRTTALRTYLWKIYSKINKYQFIDQLAIKQGQFFVAAQEQHIHNNILQMSAPMHIRYIDQYLYYRNNTKEYNWLDYKYSKLATQFIKPYLPLNNLDSEPIRKISFVISPQKLQLLNKTKQQIKIKRQQLKFKVQKQYKKYLFGGIQERTIFKQENKNKLFGEFQSVMINITKDSNTKNDKYSLQQYILPGSEHSIVNLPSNINYSQVEKNLLNSISYEVLTFKKNLKIKKQQQYKFNKFTTQQQISIYIKNMQAIDPNNKIIPNEFQYSLGSLLLQNNISVTTKQIEYYSMNKKYHIGENLDEISVCIFSYNYNTNSIQDYQIFLTYIERLNYTNYKIIWVDDNSDNQSAYMFYNQAVSRDQRIKNKIKIIRNLHHVGYLGSAHLHIKNHCNSNDIVLIIKEEDQFIGIQSFKILNSIYKNKQIWMTYSEFLLTSDDPNRYWKGNLSQKFNQQSLQEQLSKQVQVVFPFLSFRKQLLDSIPLEYLIQYRYNKQKTLAWPQYYNFAGENILMNALFQMSGKDKVYKISEYLFLSKPKSIENCQKKCKLFDIYKNKMKPPMIAPNSLGQKIIFKKDYHATEQTFVKLKQLQTSCNNCQKQIKIA